jgi:hypothetical protein
MNARLGTLHTQAASALALTLLLSACSPPQPVPVSASVLSTEEDGDRVVVAYEIVNDTDSSGTAECGIMSGNDVRVTLVTPPLGAGETHEDDVNFDVFPGQEAPSGFDIHCQLQPE